jgi:hypothetical protein
MSAVHSRRQSRSPPSKVHGAIQRFAVRPIFGPLSRSDRLPNPSVARALQYRRLEGDGAAIARRTRGDSHAAPTRRHASDTPELPQRISGSLGQRNRAAHVVAGSSSVSGRNQGVDPVRAWCAHNQRVRRRRRARDAAGGLFLPERSFRIGLLRSCGLYDLPA